MKTVLTALAAGLFATAATAATPYMSADWAAQACQGVAPEALPAAVSLGTAWGALSETHDFLQRLFETRQQFPSPTDFIGSVHNAPAGYWSIAVRSHAPSTSIACYDASFGAGLLEAAAQLAERASPVVLIAYDHVYPEPLRTVRPLAATFGVALVLTAAAGAECIAMLDVTFVPDGGRESAMDDAALEALRKGVPAARSLPLLAALAHGGAHRLAVDCGGGARLAIGVGPCS